MANTSRWRRSAIPSRSGRGANRPTTEGRRGRDATGSTPSTACRCASAPRYGRSRWRAAGPRRRSAHPGRPWHGHAQIAGVVPSASLTGGSGKLRATPSAMRRALQATTAASSTSSAPTPATPRGPRSDGTGMPASSSDRRRADCPAQVRLLAAIGAPATSPEKIALIEFHGGRCHLVDDAGTGYDEARRIAAETRGHYLDQFTNAERATDWRGNNNIAESVFEEM